MISIFAEGMTMHTIAMVLDRRLEPMVGGTVKASAGFLTDVNAAQISGTRFMKVKIVSAANSGRLIAHRRHEPQPLLQSDQLSREM